MSHWERFYMYQEFKFQGLGKEIISFLQNGFYQNLSTSTLHDHNYTEIHLILGGNAIFEIDRTLYRIQSGDILAIPPQASHACVEQDASVKHAAFQIDHRLDKAEIYPIGEHIQNGFFDELGRCRKENDYTRLSMFMGLICSYLLQSANPVPREVTDYGFLIHEFLSMNYNRDVQLSELAAALHVSNRQAERLMKRHTGKSFRQAIAHTRITIAKQLIESSELPLNEIAEYVGYRSYAGFWKAIKKHGL